MIEPTGGGQPVPVLGGAALPYLVETRLVAAAEGRVEVLTTSRPNPEIQRLMAESLAARGTGGVRVKSFREDVVAAVTTDPRTLIPLRMEVTRDVHTHAIGPDGEESKVQQREDRIWSFERIT